MIITVAIEYKEGQKPPLPFDAELLDARLKAIRRNPLRDVFKDIFQT